MPTSPRLEFAARTDTGLVRTQNEDAILINPQHGFAVLADGMGGYNAGEIASSIAVQVTSQYIEHGIREMRNGPAGSTTFAQPSIHDVVVDAFQRANAAVLDAARTEPHYSGMGTTLVAAVFHTDLVTIAHVGDSRVYRLRSGVLTQITRDHSLLQEQIDAGLVAPQLAHYAPHRNLLTRAVGIDAAMEVEIQDHLTEPGDLYLLSSDGLSDMLLYHDIRDLLTRPAVSLDAICKRLIAAANDNGGYDNTSVVLIMISSIAATGLIGRMLAWAK